MTTHTEQSQVSADDRRARGEEAAKQTPLACPRGGSADGWPAGSGGVAGRAEHDAGAGSGAGAAWPDDGVAVHVLPGGGEGDGGRPGRHPEGGPGGPGLRRCAPVELRRFRVAGTAVGVRSERFRRNPAGSVRVRPEADGGQLHHRRPQQRLQQSRCARRDGGVREGLPDGDGGVRRNAHPGYLVRPHVRTALR